MFKFFLVFLIAVACVATGYIYELNEESLNLQTKLVIQEDAFNKRLEALRKENSELKESLEKQKSISINPVQVSNVIQTTPSPAPNAEFPRSAWKAKVNLRKVEERIALSQGEREELKNHFERGLKLSELKDVIGEERANSFFKEEENARKAEEEDEIREESFKLSKVLSLNGDQENYLVQVLKEVRKTLRAPFNALKVEEERAMQLHSEPDRGDELRVLYEKYRIDLDELSKKENSIIAEKLKQTLSEDQYNKLLEYQANEKTGLR